MKHDFTSEKIQEEIRNGQVKDWREAKETEADKYLHRLLALGRKDDEIITEFCSDLDERPTFSKMLFVNPELCDKIDYAWSNALDANITDHHEGFSINACPGSYDDLKIPF